MKPNRTFLTVLTLMILLTAVIHATPASAGALVTHPVSSIPDEMKSIILAPPADPYPFCKYDVARDLIKTVTDATVSYYGIARFAITAANYKDVANVLGMIGTPPNPTDVKNFVKSDLGGTLNARNGDTYYEMTVDLNKFQGPCPPDDGWPVEAQDFSRQTDTNFAVNFKLSDLTAGSALSILMTIVVVMVAVFVVLRRRFA